MDGSATGDLDSVLIGLVEPALLRLSTQLGAVRGLAAAERHALLGAATSTLRATLRLRLGEVLALESRAARITEGAGAPQPRDRQEWLALARRPGYWDTLATHYPTLLARVHRVVEGHRAAALGLAQRFVYDRAALPALVGGGPVRLRAVELDPGTGSAVVHCGRGRVVYRPRSLAVDAALAGLIARLLPDVAAGERIRVPAVVCRDGYGWAEYVAPAGCADEAERRRYFRGLGHWLAVVRLLGGRGFAAGNLVAAGPAPVMVECGNFFRAASPVRVSGYGGAVDRAAAMIGDSVLGTGLLAAPDGSPGGVPARYAGLVVEAFDELAGRIRRLDGEGELAAWLDEFAALPVRVTVRAPGTYAEVMAGLWRPQSLHDEEGARAWAAGWLARSARDATARDPAGIAAEIDELLGGEVPVFTVTPGRGQLHGPGRTTPESTVDMVGAALRSWRSIDLPLDRLVIRSVTGSGRAEDPYRHFSTVDDEQLDRRRRRIAADIVRGLVRSAVRHEDGTVTWISSVRGPAGWTVRPLGNDVYSGASGVALLLAAYAREVEWHRADRIADVEPLLDAVLRTLRRGEAQRRADRRVDTTVRPEYAGAYLGLASRVWAWMALHRLGAVDRGEAVERGAAAVQDLIAAVRADTAHDLMVGAAGAVVPLLRFAESTGDSDADTLARSIGQRLISTAMLQDGSAYWASPEAPGGTGGLARGTTGIGWALARLAQATGDAGTAGIARAALAYDGGLDDPDRRRWVRLGPQWCHGVAGIGIVAADQFARTHDGRWREVLGRAAGIGWRTGFGLGRTLCHGDLGVWELLDRAIRAGAGPDGLTRARLDAHVITALDEDGTVAGLDRDCFAPGLLSGLGGVAYQLLRLHPESELPSVLLPDPGVLST